jgi:hypothetical protein
MRLDMRNLLVASLPLVVEGARKRDVSSSATFQLYAYSDDFGGLPLFYADGLAYVGDPSQVNNSDAAVVICKYPVSIRHYAFHDICASTT